MQPIAPLELTDRSIEEFQLLALEHTGKFYFKDEAEKLGIDLIRFMIALMRLDEKTKD